MVAKISVLLLGLTVLRSIRLVTSFENLTGYELASIRELKDHAGCGHTFYTQGVNIYLMPWICVPSSACDRKWDHILNGTQQQTLYANVKSGHEPGFCSQRWFNIGETHCCFIGDLHLFKDFELKDWPKISVPINESYWNSTMKAINAMYEEDEPASHHWMFRQYEVCAMYPVGKKHNSTLFTPHFCVEENVCDSNSTHNIPPPQGRAQVKIPFCQNNQFEVSQDRRRKKYVCCHPRAISNTAAGISAPWAMRAFPTYTLYAAGLRASIQCELYSKYVCEKGSDYCPFRSLYKGWDRALPMAAYHLAMIGIRKPRTQIFFCQGTIVSRQFILSAEQCATYNYAKASLALMGDFETYKNGEEFSVEMISYISQHVRLPPKVREDAGFVRDTCHEEIILFKLWRPMVFNPFRRPACIVGETFYPEVPKWLGKDLAYFTGYGSKEADKGYSETAKPLILETIPWTSNKCKGYYADGTETAKDDADNGEMCATAPSAKIQDDYDLPAPPKRYGDPWGPCKFDVGAPLTVLQTVPYCQLSVVGVLSREPYHCNNLRPNLFRKVAPNIEWIEKVIYKDDFDLFGFDLTWPTCDRSNWQFINMTYVSKENARFYRK
ncbi:uncharacterized protein LOC124364670 [Homalodisca vitripennis]|uniref:uncharacterized protein LOC124364670 n=1 Tax=Homalodisca vitripennis TaxID=197043 RepID=UPI001EEC09DE|nr:uncharacterized protein LOC124364670 [Homalodisca vitripennis]